MNSELLQFSMLLSAKSMFLRLAFWDPLRCTFVHICTVVLLNVIEHILLSSLIGSRMFKY